MPRPSIPSQPYNQQLIPRQAVPWPRLPFANLRPFRRPLPPPPRSQAPEPELREPFRAGLFRLRRRCCYRGCLRNRGWFLGWSCFRDRRLAGRLCCRELSLLDSLVDHHRDIAARCIDDGCQALRRGVNEEQQLGEDCLFGRHRRQLLYFFNRDDGARRQCPA